MALNNFIRLTHNNIKTNMERKCHILQTIVIVDRAPKIGKYKMYADIFINDDINAVFFFFFLFLCFMRHTTTEQ